MSVFIANNDQSWKGFFIVGTVFLVSLLLHCYDITSVPYGYLPDADYQYYFLTLYHHKMMFQPEPVFNPYGFVSVNSYMPWNLILKLNGYLLHFAGTDSFWIPKAESIAAWHIAGLFLFLTARRFFSFSGSLVALFAFLFAPNAFSFSRNYMPELIMMMLASIAFYFIICWFQERRFRTYYLSLLFSFLAICFLPKCFFIIMGMYAGFGIGYEGFKNLLKNPRTYLFGSACTIPMFIYFFSEWGRGNHHLQILVWDLLTKPDFWAGWHSSITHMATIFFLPLSCLLFFLPVDKKIKMGAAFMLLGYTAYGILFTYHIHSHPYYSIQLFLVFILSIAAIFDVMSKKMKINLNFIAVLVLGSITYHWCMSSANLFKRGNIAARSAAVKETNLARYMTRAFEHTFIVCFPFDNLHYYAFAKKIKIHEWLDYSNFVGEKAIGFHKNETFAEYTVSLLNELKQNGAQYFVVNDLRRYKEQPKLREILAHHHMTKHNLPGKDGGYFLVFDLRRPVHS